MLEKVWRKGKVYCLDTSAVLEIFYGTDKGKKIQETISGCPLYISSFTIYELLVGLKEKEYEQISFFFQEAGVLCYDSKAAKASAELEQMLSAKGTMINNVDIFIAAICLTSDATLLSCDADFQKIKQLNLLSY